MAFGYQQAKALIYSQPGQPSSVLSLHPHSIPPPHSTLLTLRTLAAPLNPADINQIQGVYPSLSNSLSSSSSDSTVSSHLSTSAPFPGTVPGNEGCFEVLAVGGKVKTVKKGDWVIPRGAGLGTWRTHLQVDEGSVIRVDPAGLTPAQVAAVSVNPVTAWRLLEGFVDLRIKDGERGKGWMIQNGANSAVGRGVLQFAKRWGIPNVAIARAREEGAWEALRAELLSLGATHVVTAEEAQTPDFRNQLQKWTNGGKEPVRLGLNCVGGRAANTMSRSLSPGGCMVTYGAMSRHPMRVSASGLIFRDLTYRGFWVSRWAAEYPEEKISVVEEILNLMRRGEFTTGPTVEVPWGWDTSQETLVEAISGTLEGYRQGKGMFLFRDT